MGQDLVVAIVIDIRGIFQKLYKVRHGDVVEKGGVSLVAVTYVFIPLMDDDD
jgi:hypothetical protein